MTDAMKVPRRRLTHSEMAAALLIAAVPAVALVSLMAGVSNADAGLLPAIILLPLVFALCLVPAWRVGPALIARYDDGALRVAPASTNANGETSRCDFSAHEKAILVQLLQWCFDGAGNGRSPLWRPWAMPHVGRRLSIAVLVGDTVGGASQLAEALSREIDGSNQLAQAGGAWSRLCLRLRVKWNDCLWWRARELADPWDSGYLVDDPPALRRLQAFFPRRPTLMVAVAMPADALLDRIAVLSARCAAFQHPIRLLVVDGVLPAAIGLTADPDGATWRTGLHGLGVVPVISLPGD